MGRSHRQVGRYSSSTALTDCRELDYYKAPDHPVAMAILAREAFAASIDEQHQDDDEAIDHLSAGLGHVHDRQHAVEEHDQHHADQRAEITAAASQDVCTP